MDSGKCKIAAIVIINWCVVVASGQGPGARLGVAKNSTPVWPLVPGYWPLFLILRCPFHLLI
jgi:hypothetical protein